MKPIFVAAAALFTALLGGCATSLQPGAEKIRMISAEQKTSCASLGLITMDQQLGPHKASNSMNMMLNEVHKRGGNAVFLVSQGRSGIDGASVTGEALNCK